MKIGIDLRNVTLGETGGLTQWLQGVLETLLEKDERNQYVVFHTLFNYHLLRVNRPTIRRVSIPCNDYYRKLQDHLDYENDFDLLFRSYPLETSLKFPMNRQVVCIPDAQQESHPENFSPQTILARRRVFHHFQTNAGAIGTLTEFTRNSLLADPWTRCEDVFLMPPALTRGHDGGAVENLTAAERAMIPASPFFLYPANLWPHKNHRRILQAFARFQREQHHPVELVLTGHPDGWSELQREFGALPVRHLGYVRPQLIATLFRRALALVYLSLFEGFGIPMLEAFAAGTPVLCSNTTSFPEVGGDAALACDPHSIEEMAAGMARIATDVALRTQLVEHGRERLKGYTWEDSAAALAAAFDRVMELASGKRLSIRVETPPVVSIVTPSLNQEQFIRRTIDSVLNQDYPHIDYRVLDGGSSDETVEILRSYGRRLEWQSEPDRGRSHAMNKGLSQAKGEILACLNSADVLRPGAVARVVEHFRDRPGCDLVYGRAALLDADERLLGMVQTADYSFERLMEQCCISQPAAFWRSRIARLAGPFDENLSTIMDYEYWMRIDRAGGCIEHIPEVLAGTRFQASHEGDYQQRFFDEIHAVSLRHAGRMSDTHRAARLTFWLQGHPWLRKQEALVRRTVCNWDELRRQRGCSLGRTILGLLWRETHLQRCALQHRMIRALKWLLGRKQAAPTRPVLMLGEQSSIGRELVIPPSMRRSDSNLRIAGLPRCDGTLSIRVGDRCLSRVSLRAGKEADIEVPLDQPRGDQPVVLEFSHAGEPPHSGPALFWLHGTNLFSERDVA